MRVIKGFIKLMILIPLFVLYANAQPGDPGGDPDIPIDGGVSILLAAGALFGMKKIYDVTKRKK
jgi:hypothetical protein